MSDASATPVRQPRILVYSDDRNVRAQVRSALGPKPAPELPKVQLLECATQAAVIAALDAETFDLLILDGEAVPSGGMGLARQLKDEVYQCPPICVLIARPQDAWLATWCRADAIAAQPIDPMHLANTAGDLLRARLAVAS